LSGGGNPAKNRKNGYYSKNAIIYAEFEFLGFYFLILLNNMLKNHYIKKFFMKFLFFSQNGCGFRQKPTLR
jgi:hypothetical protein